MNRHKTFALLVGMTFLGGCQEPSIWLTPGDRSIEVKIGGSKPDRVSTSEPYLRYWDRLEPGEYPVEVTRNGKIYDGKIKFQHKDTPFYYSVKTQELRSGDPSFIVVSQLRQR